MGMDQKNKKKMLPQNKKEWAQAFCHEIKYLKR